jgi:hypothetical protein
MNLRSQGPRIIFHNNHGRRTVAFHHEQAFLKYPFFNRTITDKDNGNAACFFDPASQGDTSCHRHLISQNTGGIKNSGLVVIQIHATQLAASLA